VLTVCVFKALFGKVIEELLEQRVSGEAVAFLQVSSPSSWVFAPEALGQAFVFVCLLTDTWSLSKEYWSSSADASQSALGVLDFTKIFGIAAEVVRGVAVVFA